MTDDPLYAIYLRLRDSVTDEQGFGGPVAHVAEVDGWTLRISTSDFGDLMVSARKEGGPFMVFEYGPDERWHPATYGATDDRLAQLTELFSRAEWHDTIQRRTAPLGQNGEQDA